MNPRPSEAERDKNVPAPVALLPVRSEKRQHEFKTMRHEARKRGNTWQQLVGKGIGLIRLGRAG